MTDSEPKTQYFDAPNPHGATGTHRMAFYEWGSPYAPPVVCVHGLTRNGRDFDYLARELAANHRVIAVDVAGRGNSDYLKELHWYDNATYMHDILALLERMNLSRFDWIGTSMGGIIGMMVASLMPGKITRLVLNDIGALIPAEGLMRIGEYVGKRERFNSIYEADSYLRKIMLPFGIKNPEHWDHVLMHTLVRQQDGSIRFAYDNNIGEAFRLAASQVEKLDDVSLWMLWEAVACPTLLIRGAQSDILPRDVALKMCETHNATTLVEFEGIGHAPTLMEKAQIQKIRDWLVANPLPEELQ